MYTSNFPSQKKSNSKKTKEWRKQCVDSAESITYYFDDTLRKSRKNKAINYNLYSDILDEDDVNRTVNPLNIAGNTTPAKMQNYPILNPKIDLLVGEELKRKFEWKVRIINDDAISKKEKDIKNIIIKSISEEIQRTSFNKEEVAERMKKLDKYVKYEYQDAKEKLGENILKHLWKKDSLKRNFNDAFKDFLISGEEIGQWDIVAGEPVFTRLNPKNVYTVRSSRSNRIEDSDIIVSIEYFSPGKIIDHYHDYLNEKQLKIIDEYFTGNGAYGTKPQIALDSRIGEANEAIDVTVLENDIDYGSPFDEHGNIRLTKVYWKSWRKMKKVKYYDEEGFEQEELMPEEYKIDKDLGEEEKIIWVGEWWEGHKIGGTLGEDDGIYVKMRPREIQYRSLENPSKCHPGIIGNIASTNDNKSLSLVDRMKPYQYMYNILYYNVELLIATNWGKIMKIPLHEMPDGWEVEDWLWFAKNMKAVPFDAFKEGKKGAATGKLAGMMQQNSPAIDMELGNTIQLYLSMMQYIREELENISGVNRQRLGQIQNRETVGGVERSVTQSSMITEYLFAAHDDWKKRCLAIGLETAKIAWKDKKNKKVQFVLDDFLTELLEIDGEDLRMIDFDIAISDSTADDVMLQQLRQLAQAGLQNDKLNFSQIMDIWSSSSTSDIKKKIEIAEEEKIQRDAKAQEQQVQMQKEQFQKEVELKRMEFEHESQMKDKEIEGKITIEELKLQAKNIDQNRNGVPDVLELEKLKQQRELKEKELSQKEKELDKKLQHESREKEKDRKSNKNKNK